MSLRATDMDLDDFVSQCNSIKYLDAKNFRTSSIKFCVDKQFINETKKIYECLQDIFSSYKYSAFFLSKIIAEYASTVHSECIECGKLFAYIECVEDLKEEHGLQALMDTNDNVVYFLNDHQDEYSEYSEYNEYNECNEYHVTEHNDPELMALYQNDQKAEILCFPCSSEWKCSVCKWQTFPCYNFDQINLWKCNSCKLTICDICTVYIKEKTFCHECYDDKHDDKDDDDNDVDDDNDSMMMIIKI